MQEIDSSVLSRVSKVLQLSTPGSEITEFQDEVLQQTLDVGPIARRGLTLTLTEGIYGASILNTHTGVQATITTIVDPWNLAGAETAPFPAAIPESMDLWLLMASAFTGTGGGSFDSADLTLIVPARNRAFGAAGSVGMRIMGLNSEIALVGGNFLSQNTTPEGIPLRIGMRVPRGATIRWRTRNGGATSPTFQVDMFLGLFPASLGQDGLI